MDTEQHRPRAMQCPLCGGPLHLDGGDALACERGHEVPASELAEVTSQRLMTALWMAINALESEAEALRLLAGTIGGGADAAARSEADARVLRSVIEAREQGRGTG